MITESVVELGEEVVVIVLNIFANKLIKDEKELIFHLSTSLPGTRQRYTGRG